MLVQKLMDGIIKIKAFSRLLLCWKGLMMRVKESQDLELLCDDDNLDKDELYDADIVYVEYNKDTFHYCFVFLRIERGQSGEAG
ncbi:hypothetical protein K7X08_021083 [Anisodus acutangulus]|uniref:Uncharacterized protein n=1 Tax=Anisodus acutangulus TaxID=402998 RepID=A0A9Q1RAH1_9SOLA|nr:hypothetical protein K7X08_021083 [Anisodus acutangulus]